MKAKTLQTAMDLAKNLKYVFVATTDRKGMPHITAAAKVMLVSENRVAVQEWFCPGTLQNVNENPSIAIVMWDAENDKGYQLLGETENVRELGMTDGYAPGIDDKTPGPQAYQQLLVRVYRILEFTHRPHTDVEVY